MAGLPATVYLVDDDERVVVALKRLITTEGFSVVCCSSAEEFLNLHDPAVPGCAVIDIGLPGMDGFGIQQILTSGTAVRPLVFLTGTGDIPASVKAMKGGAVDFLTKPAEATVLLGAICQAIGQDQKIRENDGRRRSLEQRLSTLTPRENQVLAYVVAGKLNKQIAAELGTVEKTVKVHRGRMMAKMGVRTIADLVRIVSSHHP